MAFELDTFLPYRLSVAAGRVSRRFAERYQREADISIPEWRVLAHLAHEGSVSVREIHARVDMDKSRVSRAAARLELAGHVRKLEHPEDRRLVSLSLTAQGQELMERLAGIADGFQAELVAELGGSVADLDRMLGRLMAGDDISSKDDHDDTL